MLSWFLPPQSRRRRKRNAPSIYARFCPTNSGNSDRRAGALSRGEVRGRGCPFLMSRMPTRTRQWRRLHIALGRATGAPLKCPPATEHSFAHVMEAIMSNRQVAATLTILGCVAVLAGAQASVKTAAAPAHADFPFAIDFEQGTIQFDAGDYIIIDNVRGT